MFIDSGGEFQFLIGTLKTNHTLEFEEDVSSFQFLIGTLKTQWETHLIKLSGRLFQFLIGTLKTIRLQCLSVKTYLVSIPHRHSKNASTLLIVPSALIMVSIPHRHSKNVLSPTSLSARIFPFQFLIGTLKTRGRMGLRICWRRVSIPHRHSKNSGSDTAWYLFADPFQFLIGTLKTRCFINLKSKQISFQFLIGTLKTP